jgi:hypothetical protein
MKIKRILLLFLLLPLAPRVGALAATRELTIQVPQSAVQVPVVQRVEPPPQFVELDISSWSPEHMDEPSMLRGSPGFRRGSLPQIGVMASGWRWHIGSVPLTPLLGATVTRLSRAAAMPYGAQSLVVNQDMNMFALRLGVEATPPWMSFGPVQSFLGAAALPTYAMASSSEFNSHGFTDSFVAFSATAGVLVAVPLFSEFLAVKDFAVRLGYELTRATNSANATGSGVFVGTRLSL